MFDLSKDKLRRAGALLASAAAGFIAGETVDITALIAGLASILF